MGHLIFTSTIDLLNRPPLPDRHPQSLHTIRPGETRSWTLSLQDIASLSVVKPSLGRTTKAPMIEADRYTVAAGEEVHLTVFSETSSRGEAIAPGGNVSQLELHSGGPGAFQMTYTPGNQPGVYTVRVFSDNGKTSEAKISVRHPWSSLRAHQENPFCEQARPNPAEAYDDRCGGAGWKWVELGCRGVPANEKYQVSRVRSEIVSRGGWGLESGYPLLAILWRCLADLCRTPESAGFWGPNSMNLIKENSGSSVKDAMIDIIGRQPEDSTYSAMDSESYLR